MEKQSDSGRPYPQLQSAISELITEYREAKELIHDQIQAVIANDLQQLEELLEQQLLTYEQLKEKEEQFKHHLESIFREMNTSEQNVSLKLLLQNLQAPSGELESLRNELHEQVTQTQQLREQLMDLLQFASKHNAEAFEEIFRLTNSSAESYGADGQKKQGSVRSMAINRKA